MSSNGENKCANISSMTKWLAGETEEECRYCLLPPVIQWYSSELKENGFDELASELEAVVNEGDPAGVALIMDSVKEKVSPPTKERLKEFDCAVQLHEE